MKSISHGQPVIWFQFTSIGRGEWPSRKRPERQGNVLCLALATTTTGEPISKDTFESVTAPESVAVVPSVAPDAASNCELQLKRNASHRRVGMRNLHPGPQPLA